MDTDRVERALERLAAAAARIEAAAGPLRASADPDLVRRHDALKAEAGTALRELDALIGKLGQ